MKTEEENKSFTSKDIITLKFRPQKFSEFIGQPQVTMPILNSIANGKIHHAYLFYGPRGVGKTSAARILAKMLNCLDFKNNEPCLKCENCLEISAGISPDVIEIDGASNRGIDEIRNLQSNLIYAPTKSHYKIYIIDEVHMLTKEAFNALLKTLEEPPEHIIFIFATTEIHKVLPTIRSRCQQYQFTLFKITDISSQIIKILQIYNVKYDSEVPSLIAKYGNGSMRDALSILSQILSYNDKEIKIETVYNLLGIHSLDFIRIIFEKISNKDIAGIYSICSELYYQGISLDNISTQILEFIRLITLLKNGIEDINILNQAFTDFNKLTPISESFSTKKLVFMARKLIEFQKSLSFWSNPFYAFENLLVSFIFDDFYLSSTELLFKFQEGINHIEKAFNIIGSKPEEIILKKTLLYNQAATAKSEKENKTFIDKNIQQKLPENVKENEELDKVKDQRQENEKTENLEGKKIISDTLKQLLDSSNVSSSIPDKESLPNKGSIIANNDINTKEKYDTKDSENQELLINKEKVEAKIENIKIDSLIENNEKTFQTMEQGKIDYNKFEEGNKKNINDLANNLKNIAEKELEKEQIPEPFKKLMKYMNGNYKE